jgi:hypothetical protein
MESSHRDFPAVEPAFRGQEIGHAEVFGRHRGTYVEELAARVRSTDPLPVSEPFRQWLRLDPHWHAQKYGKLSEHTIWCDLGEVLLFIVDKASLAGSGRTRPQVSATRQTASWGCAVCEKTSAPLTAVEEQEDPQEFEDRICRALWRNKAQDFTPEIEEGGRLKAEGLLGFEAVAGEEGV